MGITTTGCGSTGTSTGNLDSMIMDSRTQSDTDVSAFLTAASISDATQTQALYFLVGALKTIQSTISGSLWSRMTALYPFVGGNATAHSKDLKGAYNITWSVSGVTHNANGITGNGSTGYGDTGLNARSAIASPFSAHFCLYARTIPIEAGRDIGCYTNNNDCFLGYTNYTGFGATAQIANGGGGQHPLIASPKLGGFVGYRNSATNCCIRNSGLTIKNSVDATGKTLANLPIYLLAVNGLAGFSSKNLAFASIGSGLSDTDALNLNQIVQAYQTILGRQV